MTRAKAGGIAAAIGVCLLGPVLGILIGFFVGAMMLPPDPNFNGHAAPGDGFLIMACVLAGLLLSLPISVALAAKMLRHRSD